MTYSQYALAYPGPYSASSVYTHKVAYGDKGLEDALGLAKTFVSQLPNFKCGDLFPAALFYPDQATFDKVYKQPANSFIMNLLGFNSNYKAEAIYYCVDTTRIAGIIDLLVANGIPIPPEAI
jgi:hypothetical protein